MGKVAHPVRAVPEHPGQRPQPVPPARQGSDPVPAGAQVRPAHPSVRQRPRQVAMNARGQLHPPHAPIIEILMNLWKARALYAAARLAVPDLVAAGRHTVEDLAQATQTHAPSLHRLLRALAGCGFLAETEPGYFALTPLGDALRTDAPGAAHATVLTLAGDWQWKAWDHFIYSLRTGEPAMLQAFGKTLFEYLVESPQDSARFNEAMIGMHGRDGSAIVEVIDFSTFRTLADLGGGTGTLL